jgi:8-oxo-dGTP pyrophosphatase MutT (NUDIX family)
MRHQQDPAEKRPRQVAVIAVRRNGVPELCLIRRKDSDKWGIPKGFIDPGDSPEEAALTEAFEEAGLRGHIVGSRVGTYDYEKRGAPFTVALFVMEVLEEQEKWREMRFRERRWFSFEESALLLKPHPAWPLWDRIMERLEAGGA